jgi:hypothetical protein
MAIWDDVALGLMALNIILTAMLILVYYKNHKLIKSKMTLGMLFFAAAFLVENTLSLFFYNSLLMQGILFLTTFNLVVKFFEMIGLLILLYVTWK